MRIAEATGVYHPRCSDGPPWIELFVDKIVDPYRSSFWFRRRLIQDLCLGEILYHEVGHHVHDFVRPEYREKEDVAESWAGFFAVRHFRFTYWYFWPIFWVALKVVKAVKFFRRDESPKS
jgi:hypothetical protein